MSKINNVFKNKKAFVGYLTAGDGTMEKSLQSMLALIKGGVDILEVGVPFSDPVADGPTIQAAAKRALDKGVTLNAVFSLIAQLKQHTDIPVVLFSYYNPIFNAMARGDFLKSAQAAGVDGCLVVDLPLEEAIDFNHQCIEHNIDPILLLSPSTPIDRIKKISCAGRGMLYYVCRKGVTGVQQQLPADLMTRLKEVKMHSDLPVVAGFGIANRQMAATVLKHADGFVVGSYFVDAVAKGMMPEELTKLTQELDPR